MFWSITQDTVCPKLGGVEGVKVWVQPLFTVSPLDGVNSFTPQSLYSRGRLSGAHCMGGWVGRRVGQYRLEKTSPCRWRKLNWDSAYSLLRILQVEQPCGGYHFLLHRCYLFTFSLRRRLQKCRLPCQRKIQITPARRSVFAATLPWDLEGPCAHSHYRPTSSDLPVQTVRCDRLFTYSYPVARYTSPYRYNLRVQVFRVVLRSSSSLC